MEAALYHTPIERDQAAEAPLSARLTTLAELDATHGVAWDDCTAHAAEPNPFAERWFLAASARHLGDGGTVRAVAAFRGEALVGLMPLGIEPRYYRIPLPTLTNWVHANAFLGMPLLRAGEEAAAMAAMLACLDRAPGLPPLLHLTAIVEDGAAHRALAAIADRPVATVMRHQRALLASDLSPAAYYEATVRKKKRKELKRLAARLAELGPVGTTRLTPRDDLDEWTAAFLSIEASGWKGREGSALGNDAAKRAFFAEALAGARDAGRLEMLRMAVGDRTIAMLVNFLCSPGSASFKIAYDEDYARFSPGVLIQIENYGILDAPGIDWMDSCAAANHPMIDSLWAERRAIVRLTLPIGGARGRLAFATARAVERSWAAIKARRTPSHPQPRNDDDDADL
ncbi:GNAT family N-acetyltransferase [Sphingomonas yantingensis]|uniref:CelD/BcsL family acetyltransferase involved in cellulose biosynthesis n=1 Tax=Sphingomonas yantingensis TaxID=1241761 RepID=A0A7W9AR07_9SPHN|nr:CelD/BcsL family acetyltransferase involved in cellulose biosynthesis [Sphingomonas yantingensis]